MDYLKTVFDDIIGQYVPVTYTSYTSDGTEVMVIPDGVAGVDWSYILSGILIVVCIYGLVRIIGGIIKNV